MSNKEKDRAHFIWMEAIAETGDLSPCIRLLGIRLALHKSGQHGRCLRGLRNHSGKERGIRDRSAIRLVAKLKGLGWIKITRRGGREKANEYGFVIPDTVSTESLNSDRAESLFNDRRQSETVTSQVINSDQPGSRNSDPPGHKQ